jgi:hypothetical protein
MSTWKSKVIDTETDLHYDYINSKTRWEYSTTTDCFMYYVIADQDNNCNGKIKIGDEIEKIFIGDKEAFTLFQALGNWIESYHSREKAIKLLEENPFTFQ